MLFSFISASIILLAALYYMVLRRYHWILIVLIVVAPIIVNTVDYIVPGNLTDFRQIYYSVYALIVLVVAIKNIRI